MSEANLRVQQEWIWNNNPNSIQFQERLPEPMFYKSPSMSCCMHLGWVSSSMSIFLCSLSATVHLFHNMWGRWGCWWLLKVKYGKVLMWDDKTGRWGGMQVRVSARQPWFYCHFNTRLPLYLLAVFSTRKRREKKTAVKSRETPQIHSSCLYCYKEHIVKSIKWLNKELWV